MKENAAIMFFDKPYTCNVRLKRPDKLKASNSREACKHKLKDRKSVV